MEGTHAYFWLKEFVGSLRKQLFRHLIQDSSNLQDCLDRCSRFTSESHNEILKEILKICIKEQGESFFKLIFKFEMLILCKDENFFGMHQLVATLGDFDQKKLDFLTRITDEISREGNPEVAGDILRNVLQRNSVG